MLHCATVRDLLPQYMKNKVSPETRADIEAHIKTCPVCTELVEAKTRESHPTGNYLRPKQLLILGGAIALVLILVALLLAFFFLPAPIPKDSMTYGELRAEIFQHEKNFLLAISTKGDDFVREIPIGGFYESAMWSADGQYLVLRYRENGYTCTGIYDAKNRTIRYLDSSMTRVIRYYNSAFSFLSGETSAEEGMHYAPWAWGASSDKLLVFAKGIDPDGYTRHGYFLYSLYDGTIDGVIGFEDSYLDIPATDIPFPPAP